MPNIKFNYLYRDSGNYKKFHSVIFSNPTNIDLSVLENLIKSKLIDSTWFYADEWRLPQLFFETQHFSIDPTWHEFEGIEYVEESSDQILAIMEFMGERPNL